jgi:outer membrane protein OmpA-like peptidoglycan-associated protein
MTRKILTMGALALLWAASAQAQQRGTVEFGAFGSAGRFDKGLTLDKGFGGGGRVGIYLDPRWSVEFEKGEMKATRTLGLSDVNVGLLAARLLVTPIRSGAFNFHLGAGGGGSTETNFLHSYGVNALAGIGFAFNDVVGVRFDIASDWLAHYDWKSYQRLQAGLTFSRRPHNTVKEVEVIRQVPTACNCVDRPDSVSADEQARRRQWESDYRRLRDSLTRNPPVVRTSSSEARNTMEEHIHFEYNLATINLLAREILDEKIPVFRANLTMTILITGHAGNMGTDTYNQALGMRRAESAKAYLVAAGIAADRISVDSKGESQPVVSNAVGVAANAANRRAMFTLVIVPDVIKNPQE